MDVIFPLIYLRTQMYLKMFKKKAGMTDMIKIVFSIFIVYLSEAIEVFYFKKR